MITGVVAGFYGSRLWSYPNPQWGRGFLIQGLSAWLLWNAFPARFFRTGPVPETVEPSPKPAAPPKKTPTRDPLSPSEASNAPLLILAGACLFAALGQYFFFKDRMNFGYMAWAAGIALFLYLKPKSNPTHEPFNFQKEKALLVLVLLVAALMRFPFIAQHLTGLQLDEASCTQDGFDYKSGRMVSPFITTAWGANASFHFWWLGQFMKIFGDNWVVARAFSATVSLGVLVVFYLWSRLFFNRWASLAACLLMSVGWWFLFYSLSPFQDILVAFWEVLTFYFLSKALRDGQKRDYAWTGIFIAFCGMEYLPGRLVGFAVAAALMGILLVERIPFLKAQWIGLSLTLLSTLWLASPFIRYFHDNYAFCMGRTHNLSLLDEVHKTGHYYLIPMKWKWTFLSFLHQNPTADMRFSAFGPMVDWVCGALMVFGLVLVLTNPKKRVSWIILGGFVFAMAANALAIQGPNPDPAYVNGQRYFIVVPFIFIMVAWALNWFFGFFSGFSMPWRRGWVLLLLLAGGWATAFNGRLYYQEFHDYKHTGTFWGDLGFNHIQVADFLKANYPRCHLVVDWEYDSTTVQVLTRGVAKYSPLTDSFSVPIDKEVTKNVLVVTLQWNFKAIQEKIRKTYPNAIWGHLDNPNGNKDINTIEIPLADIQALQKKMTLRGALP